MYYCTSTITSHEVTDNRHIVIVFKQQQSTVHLLDLATRSSSSFFLIAYELDEPYDKHNKTKSNIHKISNASRLAGGI